jgi:uncharacterized surface protein with fasciclin (FAS1) repeats
MKPKHLLLALLLPLALVAAACSDAGSDDASGEDSSAAIAAEGETAAEGEGDAPAEGESVEAVSEQEDAAGEGDTTSPGNNMGSPITGDTTDYNIAEIAAGTPDVSTLTRLVITGGLLPTVRDGGPFTVLAPTNAAFAEVPAETLRALREDRAQQTDLLTLHVFPEALTSEDLAKADGTSIETVQGGKLLVEVDGEEITIGGAKVVLPDVEASNGVIHVIDSVITAPNG